MPCFQCCEHHSPKWSIYLDINIYIKIFIQFVILFLWKTLIRILVLIVVTEENNSKGDFFFIGSEVSGTDSLIWLDIKTLMMLFPVVNELLRAVTMEICKISPLDSPKQPLIASKELGDCMIFSNIFIYGV